MRNKMDLDKVPWLWRNKAVELNIANSGELVKIYLIAINAQSSFLQVNNEGSVRVSQIVQDKHRWKIVIWFQNHV